MADAARARRRAHPDARRGVRAREGARFVGAIQPRDQDHADVGRLGRRPGDVREARGRGNSRRRRRRPHDAAVVRLADGRPVEAPRTGDRHRVPHRRVPELRHREVRCVRTLALAGGPRPGEPRQLAAAAREGGRVRSVVGQCRQPHGGTRPGSAGARPQGAGVDRERAGRDGADGRDGGRRAHHRLPGPRPQGARGAGHRPEVNPDPRGVRRAPGTSRTPEVISPPAPKRRPRPRAARTGTGPPEARRCARTLRTAGGSSARTRRRAPSRAEAGRGSRCAPS